jgi:TFIIF-interacting CTD phosphatase-like protein
MVDSFKVIVFTSGLHEYVSLVLESLDQDGKMFVHQLYYGACHDVRDDRLVEDLMCRDTWDDRLTTDDNTNTNTYALQLETVIPVVSFINNDNDQDPP